MWILGVILGVLLLADEQSQVQFRRLKEVFLLAGSLRIVVVLLERYIWVVRRARLRFYVATIRRHPCFLGHHFGGLFLAISGSLENRTGGCRNDPPIVIY